MITIKIIFTIKYLFLIIQRSFAARNCNHEKLKDLIFNI